MKIKKKGGKKGASGWNGKEMLAMKGMGENKKGQNKLKDSKVKKNEQMSLLKNKGEIRNGSEKSEENGERKERYVNKTKRK